MAKRTRYGYAGGDEDEGQRPRRRPQKQSSPILPVLGFLVVIGAAIVVARMVASTEKQAQEPPQEAQPQYFSSVPDEEPPTPGQRAGGRKFERAPSELAASNPDWMRALGIAADADELFAEAQEAKANDQHALFQEKGKLAKEKYDEAFSITALWEEELLDKYGERNPQVQAIKRERDLWIARVRVLHKTTGR